MALKYLNINKSVEELMSEAKSSKFSISGEIFESKRSKNF
jgi:hypothetical protein